MLSALLKARQDFGHFPALDEIHTGIATHLAAQFGFTAPVLLDQAERTSSLYRYQAVVRRHLAVTPYGDMAEELVIRTTLEAAETMSDPAGLINRSVEIYPVHPIVRKSVGVMIRKLSVTSSQ